MKNKNDAQLRKNYQIMEEIFRRSKNTRKQIDAGKQQGREKRKLQLN